MPQTYNKLALAAIIFSPLGGCATTANIVSVPNAPCSSLVPSSLRADVPPVDLPPVNATAGDVLVALDGQTGRLDTANAFKSAGLQIIEGCEARDAAAVKRITRPWWKFWG